MQGARVILLRPTNLAKHSFGPWLTAAPNPPFFFAPTAGSLLAAIADDGVPIAVGLSLIVSGDLEREGFVMFERGTAVEADTRDTGNIEFDYKHISLFTGW